MSQKPERKAKVSKEDIKYEKQINTLERENKRLTKQLGTTQKALDNANEFIMKLVKDKTVATIVEEVNSSEVTIKEKCPNCSAKEMKRIDGEVTIIACTNCNYRNRPHARDK